MQPRRSKDGRKKIEMQENGGRGTIDILHILHMHIHIFYIYITLQLFVKDDDSKTVSKTSLDQDPLLFV